MNTYRRRRERGLINIATIGRNKEGKKELHFPVIFFLSLPMNDVLQLVPREVTSGGWRWFAPISVGTPYQEMHVMFAYGGVDRLLLRDASLSACSSFPAFGSCFQSGASQSLEQQTPQQPINVRVGGTVGGVLVEAVSARDLVALSVPSSSTSTRIPVALMQPLTPANQAYFAGFMANAAGVLGTGRSFATASGSTAGPWQELLSPFGSQFALDLGSDRVVLGAQAASVVPTTTALQWSRDQRGDTHDLELFELSVCGASIMGPSSYFWPTLIDTATSCLSLPATMHDALFAWLPGVNCSNPNDITPSMRCRLPLDFHSSMLPVLSFRVSQHGGWMQVPLELLLLPEGNGAQEFCVERSPAATSRDEPFETPIVVGTQMLRAFLAVVEATASGHRVGLAQTVPTVSQSDQQSREAATCAIQRECVGQQRYASASNECVQPTCSAAFQELDAKQGTCVLKGNLQSMATALVCILSAAELYFMAMHPRLTRDISTTARDDDS